MTAVKKIHSHTASIWKFYIDRYQFDSWYKGHKTIILNSLSKFLPIHIQYTI